jgi:hypothetical protein
VLPSSSCSPSEPTQNHQSCCWALRAGRLLLGFSSVHGATADRAARGVMTRRPVHVLLCLAAVAAASDDDGWFLTATQVTVSPPPDSCKTAWTSVGACNPIQAAVNAATSDLVVTINAGTYYNQGYNFGSVATSLDNPTLVNIRNKHHIRLQAAPGVRPKLLFDGAAGISLTTVHHISVRGLEIEGPSGQISGCNASMDRLRRTSRTLTGARTGVCSRGECSACNQTQCAIDAYHHLRSRSMSWSEVWID